MMDGERRLQEGDTERACALSLPSSSVRRALSFFRSWKVEQGALARTWLLFRSSGGATMVFALRAKRWRAERKKAYDTLLPTLLFRAEPQSRVRRTSIRATSIAPKRNTTHPSSHR